MIIALDIGNKRVGVAFSRDGRRIDSSMAFNRAGGTAESKLLELIGSQSDVIVVAGLPLNENGSRNIQCEAIEKFCRRLEKRANFKLTFVDEYGSSIEARERLGLPAQPARKQRESGEIDAKVASILLEQFLKTHRTGTNSA